MPTKRPPVKVETLDHSSGRLFCFFKRDGIFYQVECKSSLDKKQCQFINKQLGIAVFEREAETLLHSTKPLQNDYLRFLKKSIKSWKVLYPNV